MLNERVDTLPARSLVREIFMQATKHLHVEMMDPATLTNAGIAVAAHEDLDVCTSTSSSPGISRGVAGLEYSEVGYSDRLPIQV
jgi:hypothetical protein